ncbi:hypothetical protein GCM10027276_32960 [Comamonas piscis]
MSPGVPPVPMVLQGRGMLPPDPQTPGLRALCRFGTLAPANRRQTAKRSGGGEFREIYKIGNANARQSSSAEAVGK